MSCARGSRSMAIRRSPRRKCRSPRSSWVRVSSTRCAFRCSAAVSRLPSIIPIRPKSSSANRWPGVFFGETDPVGRLVRHGREATPFEIIGVAKDTTYQNLREKTPLEYYVPYFGGMTNFLPTIYADTSEAPAALAARLRPIVRQVDPRVTVKDVRTMKDVIDGTIVQERAIARLARLFSLFALTLAS